MRHPQSLGLVSSHPNAPGVAVVTSGRVLGHLTFLLFLAASLGPWLCGGGLGSGWPGTRSVVSTSKYHSLLGASAADAAEKASLFGFGLGFAALLLLLSSLLLLTPAALAR